MRFQTRALSNRHYIIAIGIFLIIGPGLTVTSPSSARGATPSPTTSPLLTRPVPATSLPDPSRDDERITRIVIRDVIPQLDEALTLHDRHDSLPDRTLLWGEDKTSNREKINDLLDRAIALLDESFLSDYRKQIIQMNNQIREANSRIADLKRERMVAPRHDTTTRMERMNPWLQTREEYDELIKKEEENIEAWKEDIERQKYLLREALRAQGLDLSEEAVDTLVSTLPGNDFLAMIAVFQNIKQVTEIMSRLTSDSDESPEIARRYYGMYVILARILERVQLEFVRTSRQEHIPALKRAEAQALNNIAEARRLINEGKGDVDILKSNIQANELTIRAARNFVLYLENLAAGVDRQLAQTRNILATAQNTYNTVSVSSDVTALIQAGARNFENLMQLSLPPLQAFRNEALRREYEKLNMDLLRSQ